MANRTENEMLFQLAAQLSGNFNSTFSSANQTILKMQQEIQTLNRTQSDISAYQKQQSAIETTKSKLEMLQKQYDNIQQEMKETGNDSADMKNKLLAKQQQIDKTSASLENQTSKLDRMGTALREAGVNTDDLTGESARLETEMNELKEAQEEAAESAEQYQQSGVQAFEAVSSALAAAGIVKGLKEIYEAYKECVGIAADFEETMSTVEALSGASDDEMSQLNDMAKELGATTKFTAIESGEAMTYMAMAGWDANEMLSGMDGVLQLAAASGEDLAMVSDIVTDNLTAFGLSASDTAHFSDILAAAATNSNTSVSIMGETFKNSASIAGALGYSVDDVAVAIGLMANAGIKGSMAGTALKNTFNGLLEGATLTSDAFGEVEFSALNTDGTMKSFSQTVNELRGYFDQMTEAERVNNAMAIAGSRSYNGLLAIVNATDDDFNSLTASINDCSGAAQKMAEIKLDNLNGDITLMNSAMDALKTTLGESYNSELRTLTSLFTSLVNVMNTFAQEHPALTKAIIAFVAVIGLATATITAYVAITKIAAVVMPLFTAAIPGVNVIMAVTAGVAALTAGIVALTTVAQDSTSEYDTWTASTKNQYDAIQELQEEYEKACETYGETSEEARALAGQIDVATQAFEESKETVAEYEAELESLNESIASTSSEFREQMSSVDSENERVLSLAARLKQLATESDNTASAQQEMSLIIASLNELLPDLDLKLEDVTSGTTDFMAAIESMAAEDYNTKKAEAALESYLALYSDLMTATEDYQKAKESEQVALGKYSKAYAEYNKAVDEYYNKHNHQDYTATDIEHLAGVLRDAEYEYQEAADQASAFADAQSDAQEAADEAGEAYADAAGIAVESYQEMFDAAETAADVSEAVETALMELANAYDEAYQSASNSFAEQFELFDTAQADADATIQAAQTAMDSQLKFWQDYGNNISTLKGVSYEDLGITQDNWTSMIAYAQSGTEEAAGFAASLAEAVNTGNTDAIVTLANTVGEVKSARDEAAGEVAAWQTDFDGKMKEIIETMDSTIDDLDMSTEASEAAQSTMMAYAESISTNGASAVANAQSIAAQVKAALSSASANINIGVNNTGSTGKGYASGTENATVGWHLVGEKGPEIVYFGGGETVYNADETKKLLENARVESQMMIVSMFPLLGNTGDYSNDADYTTIYNNEYVDGADYNEVYNNEYANAAEYSNDYKTFYNNQNTEDADYNEYYNSETVDGADYNEVYNNEYIQNYIEASKDYSDLQRAAPVEAIRYDTGQRNYTIAPKFSITCNSSEDLEDKLRNYADMLTEQVLDALEEAETDVKRGAYV